MKTLILFLLLCAAAWAQNIPPNVPSGPILSRPTSCQSGSVSQQYWATDNTTLYVCSPAGTWNAVSGGGGGGVSSVGVTLPTSLVACTGSPVTSSGTIACTFATGQTANQVLRTGSGTVAFGALTLADLPGGITASTGSANEVNTSNGSGGWQDSGFAASYYSSGTNFFMGVSAGNGAANPTYNFALGVNACNSVTTAATNPQFNTCIGLNVGSALTTARDIIAIGNYVLDQYTGAGTGVEDGIAIAIGQYAGHSVTGSLSNTALDSVLIGEDSLTNTVTLNGTTAIGTHTGTSLTASNECVLVGHAPLDNSAGGTAAATCNESVFVGGANGTTVGAASGAKVYDVAVGYGAMNACTSCSSNVAVGVSSLDSATSQSQNVAVGYQALLSSTDNSNVAVGYQALRTQNGGINNVAVGNQAGGGCTGCNSSISIGGANSLGSGVTNTICLGYNLTCSASNSVQLGNSSITQTTLAGVVLPLTVYSAAGTALPTCASGIKGGDAVVSDATVATPGTAYTSGGTYTVHVECTFNSTGSVYAWQVH